MNNTSKSKSEINFSDGDEIAIDGKRYVIASIKGGGFTLLDASSPGWAHMEEHRAFDGEDAEAWQDRSERQGAE